MANEIPDGMIPVADFARLKGIDEKKIIEMIREGFYNGRKIGDDWFVEQSESGSKQTSRGSTVFGVNKDGHDVQTVVITDIHMPFGSMVAFMVKWVIASIPAFIIMSIIFSAIVMVMGGMTVWMSGMGEPY